MPFVARSQRERLRHERAVEIARNDLDDQLELDDRRGLRAERSRRRVKSEPLRQR